MDNKENLNNDQATSSNQKTRKAKSLEELEFKDDFMFGAVMKNEVICKAVVEEIIGKEIKDLETVIIQNTIDNDYMSKAIRVDSFSRDIEKNLYAMEMQNKNQRNLGPRSNYYHVSVGNFLLDKGEDYISLGTAYVIFICDFDPMGEERWKYTFTMRADENPDLKLLDGRVTILLNTKGTKGEISDSLKELLGYISSPNNIDNFKDNTLVKTIDEEVCKLKVDKETRREYQMLDLKFADIAREAKAEGLEDGVGIGIAKNIRKLLKKMSKNQVAELLEMTTEEIDKHLAMYPGEE